MTSLVEFATEELRRFRANSLPSDMQDRINADILAIVELFENQNHSGFTASYALQALERVLQFQPLTPLTGDDEEWMPLTCEPNIIAQNKRCFHVFKRADGSAFNAKAVVYIHRDGAAFCSSYMSLDISFPYTPSTQHVDVPAEGAA